MDVTTVAKMHMDDLPERLRISLEAVVRDVEALPSQEFVWVIFTNLRIVTAFWTSEEAHATAARIERAYDKSVGMPERLDLAAKSEADLVVLIDEIVKQGGAVEAVSRSSRKQTSSVRKPPTKRT